MEQSGLWIMKNHPYIGATPDGLIGRESTVEIKCPYTAEDYQINEYTCTCSYKNENNELSLRKDHPFFFQVQGQLMVTDRSHCFFIVYTFVDIVVFNIFRNDLFIDKMFKKLEQFIVNFLKPVILNKYFFRDYDLIFGTSKIMKN